MKKMILAIAVALATLSSCTTKEYVYKNDIQSFKFNVNSNQWAYTNADNNNYFYYSIDVPEITESVLKTGLIKMYRVYDYNTSSEAHIELPYVRPLERYWTSDDTWEFYTEIVDYEISKGSISIFFTMSNFDYEIDTELVPDAMTFKCVIMQ